MILLNMRFTVSTTDFRTHTSVLWFVGKCKNNVRNHMFVPNSSYHDECDNEHFDFISNDDEFHFFYSGEKIYGSIKELGKPFFINSRHEAGYYSEIILEVDNDLPDEDKITFMKKFITEAKDKYRENKLIKSSDDKIFLWSYSGGYWEHIKKINKRDLDTVILDKEVKDEVQKSIDNYNNEDLKKRLNSLGINHKLNLVLSGLPGTGKSSLMYSIASKLNKDIATIDFNNKELCDHSFICATNRIPKDSIFVLEDIDALYIERDKKEDNRVSFSCILNFLDGVYSKTDLITIITTNHIERLDKAIIRPMRMDNIITFTHCSKYQYHEIFKKIFPEHEEINENLYKVIKHKKFTTSILQKFLIRYIYEPELLIKNVKIFEEYISMCSDKDPNMFM